jgi:hypothetical protein
MLAFSALAATSALAAGKPLVETKAATGITKSEATLNGVVDPNGAETKYHFEYGTSTSYGASTPEVYVGSGTTSVEELQKVASLLADDGYDFRIVATNKNGTTDGANETFKTTGTKVPLAETVGASAVTETGATLNGVVNPDGVETKYSFQYGTTISYGKETAAVSAGAGTANLNESKAVTGLTAKTTYHYRVVATNANGTTDGPDQTFYSEVGPEFKPLPAAKRKFKGTSGAWNSDAGGRPYSCPKGTVTGEFTGGRNLGNVVVTFTGCISGESEECPVNTYGAAPGEIASKALTGELGTVATKEAPTGVGLRLKPEVGNSWWTMVRNSCTGEAVWAGTLGGEVEVIGKKQTTDKLVFTNGIRKITLDSGVSEGLELEEDADVASWSNTSEVTFEEPVEVT